MMGLDAEFPDGVAWVKAKLDFDVDGEVSVFETSIRLVGGLLSAHHACGDPVLLAKARDLADRLMPASRHRRPACRTATSTCRPARCADRRPTRRRPAPSSPSSACSAGDRRRPLSRRRQARAGRDVRAALEDRAARRQDRCMTGEWNSRRATVGPPSDSYYEYLWDGWDLLGDAECKRDVRRLHCGDHQASAGAARRDLWFVDVDFETGAAVDRAGRTRAPSTAGCWRRAATGRSGRPIRDLGQACRTRYGMLPEGYRFRRPAGATNDQRAAPGTGRRRVQPLAARPPRRMARRSAATHYLAMKRWNKARYGYADIADVTSNPKVRADHCPGYWWSEQMKYYCLLFADTPRFDYRRLYLSTEGNVLRGLHRATDYSAACGDFFEELLRGLALPQIGIEAAARPAAPRACRARRRGLRRARGSGRRRRWSTGGARS